MANDELKSAAPNAQVEGADISADEIVPPVMANNYVQILTASFKISDTAERVKKYGRASEIKYQTAKKLKEIALDIEYAAVNNTTAAAGNATTARTMKGLEGWIVTNDDDLCGPGNYQPVDRGNFQRWYARRMVTGRFP